MSARTTFLRWLPTFLAFPLGGLLAVTVVGSVIDPLRAAMAGLLAGAVIGLAQWLALRPSGLGVAWVAASSAAVAVGSALPALVTGAGTSTSDLVVAGFLTGACLGVGQGLVARVRPAALAGWTAVVAIAWGVGWFITANVIVDAGRGYIVFGSSGALVATILTGLLVHRLVVVPRSALSAGAEVGSAASAPVDGAAR